MIKILLLEISFILGLSLLISFSSGATLPLSTFTNYINSNTNNSQLLNRRYLSPLYYYNTNNNKNVDIGNSNPQLMDIGGYASNLNNFYDFDDIYPNIEEEDEEEEEFLKKKKYNNKKNKNKKRKRVKVKEKDNIFGEDDSQFNKTKATPTIINANGTSFNYENEIGNFSVGDERAGCPACVSGECAGNVKLTSLPIIQILVAIKAGLILAKIFIWIYYNFFEKKEQEKDHMEYGYVPVKYGPPSSSYNLPPPSSSHSSGGYNRKSVYNYPLEDINQLTDNVWSSVNKYSTPSTT